MKINTLLFSVCLVFISCKENSPRKPVSVSKTSELDKTVLLNKHLFSKEQILMKRYMELDSTLTYVNSKKGFWYAYIEENKESNYPVKGDEVFFEQEIIGLDGAIIYAKKDLGLRKYVVDKEYIIKGLKEGIKLMKEGEEVKFLFSSFVAYRMNGDASQVIGSNEPLVSVIKLVKINKVNN